MFQIVLTLDRVPSLTGCQALDFERHWGLPETGQRSQLFNPNCYQVTVTVPEAFARAHFDADALRHSISVPIAMLQPGEIIEAPRSYQDSSPDLRLSPTITPERAMLLF